MKKKETGLLSDSSNQLQKNQLGSAKKYFFKYWQFIISPKNGQKIPKITNLQYNKGRANYGTKKKSIYG